MDFNDTANGQEPEPKRKRERERLDIPPDGIDKWPYSKRPRNSIHVSELRPREPVALTAQDYATKITAAWRKTLASAIETGHWLNDAKKKLGHGNFYCEVVDDKLEFGRRQAQMLMAIARHKVLSDAQYIAHLPKSWATVYELTSLLDDECRQLIANGRINPAMERRDAVKIARLPPSRKTLELLRELFAVMEYNTPQQMLDHYGWADWQLYDVGSDSVAHIGILAKWLSEIHDLCAKAREEDEGEDADRQEAEDADWDDADPAKQGAEDESAPAAARLTNKALKAWAKHQRVKGDPDEETRLIVSRLISQGEIHPKAKTADIVDAICAEMRSQGAADPGNRSAEEDDASSHGVVGEDDAAD
jgi:DUF3102 family protein